MLMASEAKTESARNRLEKQANETRAITNLQLEIDEKILTAIECFIARAVADGEESVEAVLCSDAEYSVFAGCRQGFFYLKSKKPGTFANIINIRSVDKSISTCEVYKLIKNSLISQKVRECYEGLGYHVETSGIFRKKISISWSAAEQ